MPDLAILEPAALEKANPLDLFTHAGVNDILDRLRREVLAVETDISTAAGRKAVASLAYKVAQSKTFLDGMGAKLVSGWKEQAKCVDVERKRIRDELDALKDQVRKPLTEWEDVEKRRVKGHEDALVELLGFHAFVHNSAASSETIRKAIGELATCHQSRDWQEFLARANGSFQTTTALLQTTLHDAIAREAEQAELDRFRREEATRKQQEHEERIRTEAATKATRDAEAKARREAEAEAARVKAELDWAVAEQARLEQEKFAAERHAAKAEQDRIKAAAKAEVDRKAVKEQGRRAAIKLAETIALKEEAERRAEERVAKAEAAQQERIRIANEQWIAEEKAKAKREPVSLEAFVAAVAKMRSMQRIYDGLELSEKYMLATIEAEVDRMLALFSATGTPKE